MDIKKSVARNENSIRISVKSKQHWSVCWLLAGGGAGVGALIAQLRYKDVITSNYNYCRNYQIMNNTFKLTLSRLPTENLTKLCKELTEQTDDKSGKY